MGHAWRTKCSLEGCLRHKNRGIPQGKALSERKRTCRFSPHDKSQGQIIRKRTLCIRTNGTARFLCQNLSKCLHFFDYVQNRVAGSIEFAARSALGATIARCRLPVARRCPFGICSSFACYPALRPLVAARRRMGSRARSVWCKLFSLLFACRPDLASARRPADYSPWASLLSTPRCLATRSTGAFSCRRSRCLGRRLLPPSVVLVGRGSWARGVPRG